MWSNRMKGKETRKLEKKLKILWTKLEQVGSCRRCKKKEGHGKVGDMIPNLTMLEESQPFTTRFYLPLTYLIRPRTSASTPILLPS